MTVVGRKGGQRHARSQQKGGDKAGQDAKPIR